MARYRSIEEILTEEDELGLLNVTLRPRAARTPEVEQLLHRFFDAARPRDLWITDRFGRKVYPREWFYVLPEHVSRAVQAIRDGNLHELEYDPESQRVRKKNMGER